MGHFYPRPPRGGRHRSATHPRTRCQFLSTPSARRATSAVNSTRHTDRFLSTPSARRATYQPIVGKGFKNISIHALREEGDSTPTSQTALLVYFYPRPPRGGRHRLRSALLLRFSDFYPRPPRGGRRTTWMEQNDTEIFLSTPSARRATRASFSRSFWI